MNSFLTRHDSSVTGMLCGWDRVGFRGTLRVLASVSGLCRWLSIIGCLMKDLGDFALDLSDRVKAASLEAAELTGRPIENLASPRLDKEQYIRGIQQRDPVDSGLIAVLKSVESCWSFGIKSKPDTDGKKYLRLVNQYRKCQHLYHYHIHPVFGAMHVRLQTWLPFNIHICINGREWLARQMDAAGIAYRRSDNCFTWISDPAAAQQPADAQNSFDIAGELSKAALLANPAPDQITRGCGISYYWSADQSEYASDVMFKDHQTLDQLYPGLIRHGMQSLQSRDVMRFLGRSVPGKIQPQFNGQVVSDLRGNPQFYEGQRLRHRVNCNSIKMYNKAQSVLRVETTINQVRDLKSPRFDKEGKKSGERCAKASPTSRAAPRCRRPPTSVISKRWQPWTCPRP